MPSRGDSEQRLRARVARLEAQMEMLGRALAEVTAQRAEAAQAASPDRPRRPVPPRRGRRPGDTFLTVVKVVAALAACLTIVLAAMGQRHLRDLRYSPRCTVACARPVAHVDSDGDHDGG